MTHTYTVSGMTCAGCQATVQKALSNVPGVKAVAIDLAKSEATVEMNGHHVPTAELKKALQAYPKYSIEEKEDLHTMHAPADEEQKTWWQTYKPILLVFAYLTGATLLIQVAQPAFDGMQWMRHFMAGFFLVFSFFKLLDLKGFAENYFSYDIIARKWMGWGYVYAFIELLLGIAFLVNLAPVLTNAVTLVVMSISIIGVLKSVLNGRKIRCACLGAVFNVPMSTITIIEDALMIGMSGVMLLMLL
jgi:copper chaperone CopZ